MSSPLLSTQAYIMPCQSLVGQVRPMQTQCISNSESHFWANCTWYYQNDKLENFCTEI